MEDMEIGIIGNIGIIKNLMVVLATIIQEVAVLQRIINSMLAQTALVLEYK